ncbi:hypothetical protein LZD49_22930 [Dyadobacter sp. CY261]|uniref:hypothetical protein n=1 Tax=Dyadobacter sp. CY261 TaxID=2907203 RepID=UPI001F24E6A3|nr:hypothetical protein [Dyadobacter sp. CY261]MCF0073351.1 hypothetical protein [Dyadobacter sp. CY261]
MEENEKSFKQLISKAAAEVPSDAFTQAVMLRVQEESAFHVLMQQNAVEMPSATFSNAIMAEIRASQPVTAVKPFVPRKMWYWIAAAWAVLLIACLFVPGNEESSALLGGVNTVMLSSKVFTERLYVIPQSYMLTIIGLSSLLLLDYFLRNKWVLSK